MICVMKKNACYVCDGLGNLSIFNIENNASIGDEIFQYCESNSVVPNDACNGFNGDDVTNGICNYCPVL